LSVPDAACTLDQTASSSVPGADRPLDPAASSSVPGPACHLDRHAIRRGESGSPDTAQRDEPED
jgi:hypothetical protein